MKEGRSQKVLLADDDPIIIKFLGTVLLKNKYDFAVAVNGAEAIEKAKSYSPDLILLDVMMPQIDGFEVCRRLKEDPTTKHIPIIIITALADREPKVRGLAAGANDFLTKPIDRAELMARAKNLLRIKEFEDFLRNYNETLKKEVEKKTIEIKEGYIDTILRLTVVAEYRDGETAAHIRRMGYYCAEMAKHAGWSDEDRELIFYASPMHDIGKVGIPLEILLKRSSLTPEEFALIKTHTLIGANILQGSKSKYLEMARQIALTHHERWDGTGYPKGLEGEEIPLAGRIVNMIDQYDALRSKRPYKDPLDHETAVRTILRGDGRTSPEHFDPDLRKVFAEVAPAFSQIFERYSG
jgi:putative two-component system response regulator